MTLAFTDRNLKTVLHSWGRFRAPMYEDVVVGDLLALKSGTTYSLQLADSTGGYGAIAVAVENILAGKTGWCALAAELKAPTTLGTGGVITQQYFDDGTDVDIGQDLYLKLIGKCDETQGTLVQRVGYNMTRSTILLVPGGSITGAAGSFTSLTADDLFLNSGAVINFAGGDITLTHATGKLTLAVAVAAPALADGYGFFEANFNLTGQATGFAAGDSTWLNLEATFKALLGGGLVTPHTDGIYMVGGAEITAATVALIGKFTDQMNAGDFYQYNLFNLNLTQTLTALYEVNNPALMGYTAGSATDEVGSIPFFSNGPGSVKYIMIYSHPA